MFWIAASLLTALVLVILLRAFVLGSNNAGLSAADVYNAQLKELEREAADGLIPADESASARMEIVRRLGRTDAADSNNAISPPSRIVAGFIGAVIIVGALGTYMWLGRPELPAQPFVLRDIEAERAERLAPTTSQIEAELAAIEDPADRALYLASLFMSLGAYEDARVSFSNALEHRPGDSYALAGLGESYVLEQEGIVPDEAVTWFEQALVSDPLNPRATAYLALYDAQHGAGDAAFARIDALIAAAPEAPWRPRLEDLRAQIVAMTGSTASEVAQLPDAEREAAIRGMVDGLAARLAEDPDDFEGWLMLANSRAVLGERDAAEAALAEAARIAGEEPRLRTRVSEVAAQHGLSITTP